MSSFGISGTNAHVILEQAPPEFATPKSGRNGSPVVPWVLSAKSASALAEQAARLRGFVEQHSELDPHDIAYSLVTTRASFDHRAVAVGADRDELLSGLAAIASGAPAPNVVTGKAAATGGTVFVFPGQGSQWTGMAVELLDSAPAFADQMRLCDAAFAEFVDWSLLDAVRGGPGSPSLDRVDVVQPVLFAVMVSLAAQWRALGIHPDAVLGHSQGEIAAAYVAGALSLRDAARVVTLRSRAIRAIAGTGGMVSIPRSVEWVHAFIEPWGESISFAAQNGPSSTVVTGNAAALDELMAECERDDVPATRIPVDYASHSAHVEELRETLRGSLPGCSREPATSHSSPRSPAPGWTPSILDGDYWFANLRQPVLFEQAVRWAYEHGYRTFIESSPHPVLTVGIQESLEDSATTTASSGRFDATKAACAGSCCRLPKPTYTGNRRTGRASSTTPARVASTCPPTPSIGSATGWTPRPDRRREQPRRHRRGASSARCGCATRRFGRSHSHRPAVARIPSVAGRPQSAGVVLVPGAAMVEMALHAGDRQGAHGWTNSCCTPR